MIRHLVLFCVLFISACSNKYTVNNKPDASLCNYVSQHFREDGRYIAESYLCIQKPSDAFLSLNKCALTQGYYKNDGSYINNHYRCDSIDKQPPPERAAWLHKLDSLSSPASSAGCVTNCSVRVRGYTRKDGTYVRPHTRSAPRR